MTPRCVTVLRTVLGKTVTLCGLEQLFHKHPKSQTLNRVRNISKSFVPGAGNLKCAILTMKPHTERGVSHDTAFWSL